MALNVGFPALAKKGRLNQIISQGRGQPISPQALVVLNVSFENDIGSRSQKPDEIYAPYTEDPKVYNAQKGEWCLARVDDFYTRGSRPTLVDQSSVTAITCVNGLKKSDRVVALGICDNPSMQHNGDQNADFMGVARIAGSCTGINTGPEPIPAMSQVFLLPDPYVITDEESGEKIPGISNVELGYPANKFLPRTIAMTTSDTSTLSRSLELRLEDTAKNAVADNWSAQKFDTEVKRNIQDVGVTIDWPLYSWGQLRSAALVLEELHETETADLSFNQKELLIDYQMDVLNRIKGQDHFWAQKYFTSLGKEDLPFKTYQKQTLEADFNDSRLGYNKSIGRQLRRTSDSLLLRNIDMCNQYYLGLSTTNSKPGRPLDIILRASRC